MPYGISPMVIYYNTELVDFERMERRGLDVPSVETAPTERPHTAGPSTSSPPPPSSPPAGGRADGVWIEPTLPGLAPFIYSGGGKIFDDDDDPTSLAFSDDATRRALDRTLAVLRDPPLTPSAQRARGEPALERFERGKLGMIAGFRDLVPELRQRVRGCPSTSSRCRSSRRPRPSATSTGCASRRTPSTSTRPPTSSRTPSPTRPSSGRPRRLPRAGQHRGRGLRGLPRPGPAAGDLQGLQHRVRGIVVPPLLDNGAELEDAVGPMHRRAGHRPRRARPRAGHRGDRRGVPRVLSPEEEPSESPSE